MSDRVVLFELELFQLVVIVVGDFALHRLDPGLMSRATSAFRRFSKHRRVCVLLVGCLGFAASAALSGYAGLPVPRLHDEFCYLLQGDTFAHGRLTNPPHPHWVHFEAIHINHQPTYHPMYPPGQGVALAAGQVVFGHPIAGVWLSIGLACAAVCWMLQSCVPPQWALAGGLLAVCRFVFMRHPSPWMLQVGYWSHSYWGGAVALLGGALVFGGARRIFRRPRALDATFLGLGLAILANSRPFEGFVAGLPVALLTLYALWRHRRGGLRAILSIIAPLTIVLASVFAWMSYYNWRTTGDPGTRPYELNGRLYAVTPTTLLQEIGPTPEYRHEQLFRYHADWARTQFLRQQTIDGYLTQLAHKANMLWSFYFGLLLSLPMVAMPWALRDGWTRFAAMTCLLVLCALMFVPWFQVHYLAPIASLFVFLEVACLRVLSHSRYPPARFWRALAAAILVSEFLLMPISAAIWLQEDQSNQWFVRRQEILEELLREDGKHLVLVAGNHSAHDEWVYNGADLDGTKVLWAHDMGPARNAELLNDFRDRRVWVLSLDRHPLELRAATTPTDNSAAPPATEPR